MSLCEGNTFVNKDSCPPMYASILTVTQHNCTSSLSISEKSNRLKISATLIALDETLTFMVLVCKWIRKTE